MERSNTHPITDEQQTIKKVGSIDWNAVITSLQQTIEHDKVTRGFRDDRISELEDRVELLEKKLLEVGIKVDDDAHLVDDEEEEPFDIEYDCPKCGINRGKHCVSKRNRLIPCESDGEDDEEEDEEEDDQYKKICDDDGCNCVLCINTPIMCYSNDYEGDLTLCNNCYWDNEYWRDDQNEDNEDEVKDYICDKLRNDPNFVDTR